ncbi:unnamed protein product [Paramecium primaurelia]|uniref:Uncharacterized protein n=1 Tax=Paramecium primaurelia TaxID=5886 RepID=A0A8S1LHJ7_PARPR|nr:unnamed protein product [Paramecium primaurelia]
MQINGRLQFDLKLDDKDYKISGDIFMKENISTDVEKEAETIANRIIEKVRQKSLNKSINKSVQHKYESQSATKFSQTEHFKSIEQSNSRQETLKNDYKQPYLSEYQTEFRSSCKLNNIDQQQQIDICELITPQKHKQRNTKSQQCIKKDQPIHKQSTTIQLAESQYIIENNTNSNTKDGKQIIQLIDNAHNLIRKNSQILNKVQLQSPLQSVINTKYLNTQNNKKKEDIVTQLLGSLRNAKKIKDEYQKRFF